MLKEWLMTMTSKEIIYNLSDDEFRSVVKESHSIGECLTKLGVNTYNERARKSLKERMQKLMVDFSKDKQKSYSLEEMLVENSCIECGSSLLDRLVKEGLKDYRCEKCGNKGTYNGKPLRLQLHHKNGKHNDNRIENLEILCPNCHTQTDNYAGKNQEKAVKKSKFCACGMKISYRSFQCRKCARKNAKHIHKNGFFYRQKDDIKTNPLKIKLPERDEFIENHKKMNQAELAKLYKVSVSTIKRWNKELNIDISKRNCKLDSKVIELYNMGYSIEELAMKYSTKKDLIIQFLKDNHAID